MSGTPIIANVTGGLQDQIGQVDNDGKPLQFTVDWGSNHDGRFKNHGVWAKPVWPSNRSLQGSIPTPYISDDRAKIEDVVNAICSWYKTPKEERKKAGLEGRRWALNEGGINAENMCARMGEGIDLVFKNWKPRPRFSLHTTDEFVGHNMPDGNLGMMFDLKKEE